MIEAVIILSILVIIFFGWRIIRVIVEPTEIKTKEAKPVEEQVLPKEAKPVEESNIKKVIENQNANSAKIQLGQSTFHKPIITEQKEDSLKFSKEDIVQTSNQNQRNKQNNYEVILKSVREINNELALLRKQIDDKKRQDKANKN